MNPKKRSFERRSTAADIGDVRYGLCREDVLGRVGRDIAQATGLSGPEFGVFSRLAAHGKDEMRQQALAGMTAWDKSCLSHQLTRMQERALIERHRTDGKTVLVALTKLGREKLDAARPIHAASVRQNLLSRLTQERIDTILRVSNLLGLVSCKVLSFEEIRHR